MLTLHKEKGVNPRMTTCRQCGKDVGLVLLGVQDFCTTCPRCDVKLIGGGKCPHCNEYGTDRKPIGEHEKIPIEICNDCKKKNEECDEVVKSGGIYWRCVDCGSAGALKACSELAQAVREKLNILAPDPCGIEFSKECNCPVCGKH